MKKATAIALVFVLLISSNMLTELKAESEYIKNFSKTDSYTYGQFSDVGSEWYAEAVKSVYELGLMKGTSADAFTPNENISNIEIVTIVARIHSIYNTGQENFTFEGTGPWYKPYLYYAIENGICTDNFDPVQTASRSFFAGVLYNAIDTEVLSEKNHIEDGSLWDVDGWYSEGVYKMYRAGVLCGNDSQGTFAPSTPITRAAVATIIDRVIVPSHRVAVNIEEQMHYTVSAPLDGSDLESFRQRAIVANLKWLLSGEAQGPEWQTDVYKIYHEAVPGENIHVPRWALRYEDDETSRFIFIPKKYLGISGEGYVRAVWWNLYTGSRSLLPEYTCSMPDGEDSDVYLTKPAQAAYTTQYTYADYTGLAQSLINAAWNPPTVNKDNTIKTGKLVFWDEKYYIQDNPEISFLPIPEDAKYAEWLSAHLGKNVYGKLGTIQVENVIYNIPYTLSEVNEYPQSSPASSVRSWSYNSSSSSPLTINFKSLLSDTIEINNEALDNYKQYLKENFAGLYPVSSINGFYYSMKYLGERFLMNILIDDITVMQNGITIRMKFNSSDATIEQNGTKTNVTITPPRRCNGVTYLPGNFINQTLFEKTTPVTSTDRTEEAYDKAERAIVDEIADLKKNGYAKVMKTSSGTRSYLEGHDDITFIIKRESIDGYEYCVVFGNYSARLGFNLDSEKACIQITYDGYTMGEKIINIPAPKKIGNDFYLPAEEVLAVKKAGYIDGKRDPSFKTYKF